jgi:hypothetical protein
METSFWIQYILAFILTLVTIIFSFLKISEDPIDFISLSSPQRLYFSSLIINMIFFSLIIIYSILYCFWTTITCCWGTETDSIIKFSFWKAFFVLTFLCANGYILYSLYINPLELPVALAYAGNIMLIYFGTLIFEGLLFLFIRDCLKNRRIRKSRKKKLLPLKEKQHLELV